MYLFQALIIIIFVFAKFSVNLFLYPFVLVNRVVSPADVASADYLTSQHSTTFFLNLFFCTLVIFIFSFYFIIYTAYIFVCGEIKFEVSLFIVIMSVFFVEKLFCWCSMRFIHISNIRVTEL